MKKWQQDPVKRIKKYESYTRKAECHDDVNRVIVLRELLALALTVESIIHCFTKQDTMGTMFYQQRQQKSKMSRQKA